MHLQKEGLRRLSLFAFVFAAFLPATIALRHIGIRMGFEPNPEFAGPADLATVVIIIVSVGAGLALRSNRLSMARRVNVASTFEVFEVFYLAFLERLIFDFGTVRIPISVTIIAFLIHPPLWPQSPRRRMVVWALCVVLLPTGNFLAATVGNPIREGGFWLFSFVPTIAISLIGLLMASVMYRLGREVGEARKMGSYRLTERIGEGGMGEVWLAEHQLLARPAAVKLIRPDVEGKSEEALARFEREAHATARLRSPHTVELYDFGRSDDGTFYYVMEYLEGVDLEGYVEQHGPLDTSRTIHVMRQACLSLAEAHSMGLVHRDVKPGNLFLCSLGGVNDLLKVLDFGLVKPANDLESRAGGEASPLAGPTITMMGSLRGTPTYMSPEQALGNPADARSDIYSLGCVAFWLLTGRPPFEGKTMMAVLSGHIHDPPELPSAAADQVVPARLDAVVARCMEKKPEDRYQNAREMLIELNQLAVKYPWDGAKAEGWWAKRRTGELPAVSGPRLSPSLAATLVETKAE